MRRRMLAVLLALGCLALAAAPSAQGRAPTIVTDITFPEEGEPFGTFTASDPLCPSGTFVDQFVGGGGSFRSERVFVSAATVRKVCTCDDGSGTSTIQFHPQSMPATAVGCGASGPFAVVPGTGAHTRHGDFCVFGAGGDEVRETFTAPSAFAERTHQRVGSSPRDSTRRTSPPRRSGRNSSGVPGLREG